MLVKGLYDHFTDTLTGSHDVGRVDRLDIYENNAYDIQQELLSKYEDLDLVVLIASVRNTSRMNASSTSTSRSLLISTSPFPN